MITRAAVDAAVIVFESSYTSPDITLDGKTSLLICTTSNVPGTDTVTWNGVAATLLSEVTSVKFKVWLVYEPAAGTAPVIITFPGLSVSFITIETATKIKTPTPYATDASEWADGVAPSVSIGTFRHSYMFVGIFYGKPTEVPPTTPTSLTKVAEVSAGGSILVTYADRAVTNPYGWSMPTVPGTAVTANTVVLIDKALGGATSYSLNRFDIGEPVTDTLPEVQNAILRGDRRYMGQEDSVG